MWAQKDERSRVTVRLTVRWMQLLEALKGLWNRGFSEGICIQREGYCMCRLHEEKELSGGARRPLYIEGIQSPCAAEAAGGGRRKRPLEA